MAQGLDAARSQLAKALESIQSSASENLWGIAHDPEMT